MYKKKRWIFVLVGILFFLLLFVRIRINFGTLGMIEGPPIIKLIRDSIYQRITPKKVIETKNKGTKWHQEEFAKHVNVLELRDGKVFIDSDGYFSKEFYYVGNLKPGHFFLNLYEGFVGPGDDHFGGESFRLEKINSDSAEFSYESVYDGSEFGDRRILIDRGTIHLPWKP